MRLRRLLDDRLPHSGRQASVARMSEATSGADRNPHVAALMRATSPIEGLAALTNERA
jgi:hypothetical protein